MRKIILLLYSVLVLLMFLWLIRPSLLGQLNGTFQKHNIPKEYVALKDFFLSGNNFSRTLWIPTVQRFGFSSQLHPIVDGYNFFHVASPTGVLTLLPASEQLLQVSSIRYVVVPYDSEGEIFLKDRKYNTKSYEQAISEVRKINWLSEKPGFGRIHVFEVKNVKDHFWSLTNLSIIRSYVVIDPTRYLVHLQNAKKGDILIFSEGFDSYWQLIMGGRHISSRQYQQSNSFIIPKSGTYDVEIIYITQKWVNIGLWISGITAVMVFFIFLGFASKMKHV